MQSDMKLDVQRVINALHRVLPPHGNTISLHEPLFSGKEWQYVKECLDTGWVSSAGTYVDSFEEKLASYLDAKRVVAVVNGTAALHICLLMSGVKFGDEVLMPTLTFIATANAVTYCGAVPHFVDSDEKSLGIDPDRLSNYLAKIAVPRSDGCYNRKTGRRIKAIVAVHIFGHPVNLDPLLEVCQRFQIELVEDAAESLGSKYKGRHTGTFGRCSALSFNGNKTITTGGGGAIITNDEELGRLAKHITSTAKLSHPWAFNHDMVGYNYRMPNINAALGCAQFERISEFLERKRTLAVRYQNAFSGIEGIRFFVEQDFAESSYWLNALVLDEEYAYMRDELLLTTNQLGIATRPAWTLMHLLPMFAECPRMNLAVAESLSTRLINIPSSVSLA